MSNPKNRFLRCFWLAGLLGLAAVGEDPVLAQRGSDQITVSQARALIANTDAATQHRLATDQAALKDFLRNVLLQRAILTQAQAEKWDQRADVANLLQRAHDQVIAQSFLAGHAPVPAAYPSDADIQTAYTQNTSRFMQPRSYHLTQLFLPRAAYGAPDDGRRKLAALRAQIQRARLSFEAAAKQGGVQFLDMGWVSETMLVPAVKTAVAGLPEGVMADPLCIENGCHLLRLVATRPAGPAPLAAVKDDLVRALRQQKQQAEETAYANGLLAKQPVAINEIQLSHVAP
jgi:peptidylprolyl isomerase